ncbi:MAG TPA: hypothetical protein VHF25_17215 [Nitriliruptorales bacterium]|nr:hypothetical protein [Nitriliruptorales bacterium]
MRARYRRWDGTQDPLGEELDVGAVLERLGDDLLMGAGADVALQRLRRRGVRGRSRGIDDLLRQLRARRERLRREVDLDGPLADVRRRLDEIVALEREALAADASPEARFGELRLDTLPANLGQAIRELQDHTFASEVAAARFAQLVDDLRRQVLDAYVRDLSATLQRLTPQDLAGITAMLADLNAMLVARARGEEPDFEAFMDAHGHHFPERPADLDELLEVLARRMAAMSRLLASMTPRQREELQQLAQAVLDDLDLAFQMSQLEQQLRGLLPQLPWNQGSGQGARWGDEPVPLSGVVDAFERIGELDELERQLEGDYPGATLDDVDEETIRRTLGDDAATDLRRLRAIERALEEAGALQHRDGRLQLTPRGARMLGERVLTTLFDRIRRQTTTRTAGVDAEPTGHTRPWRFGDREPIAVQRTVANAVLRHGPGRQVRLSPDDFEVQEMEVRPRTATALLLDLSFSMPLRGHFIPAKKMALALHALIQGKYPQDALYLIGFSDYARRLQPADLGAAGFERVYGTNMQHAFLLARRLLNDDARPVKQVIMVTDGEPTAHLVGELAEFHWPPVRETVEKTLREAVRLARSGIALHVFLLEQEAGLVAFADRLARLTGGQVFQATGDDLGRFVVRDYVRRAG